MQIYIIYELLQLICHCRKMSLDYSIYKPNDVLGHMWNLLGHMWNLLVLYLANPLTKCTLLVIW